MKPERLALNSLLITALLASAPHVHHLPLWLTLVCAGGFAWRFAIHTYGWPAPPRLVRLSLTLLVFTATLAHYGTLLGRDAGTGLLASLLALKLLELRTRRDCLVAVLLCYLLLLTAFLFEQPLWLAFHGLLTVWSSVVTLVLLNQPTLRNLRHSLRLAGILLLKAVPLALAMFVLFPRIEGSLWGLPSTGDTALTGLSEFLQPGSVHRLIVSDAPAFRVEFEGEAPVPAQLYWRTLVLSQTDGPRWSRSKQHVLPDVGAFTRRGPPVKYRITLEPNDRPWLPALDLPLYAPPRARALPGHVFEYRQPVRERLSYTLVSYPRYDTGALSSAERAEALQLPATLSARVQALAQQWRANASKDIEVAQAALAYFREQPFFYTLNPPLLGADPVDEFLFSARRGFCGHFASAFVTLMRAAGVPSRIVQGYLGGEYNPAGKYWIVRQSDAHAWAEIWVPQQGWLRVDPTAAVAPERVELGIDAVRQLELTGVELGRLPTEALRKLIALGWFASSLRTANWYWDATNLAWHRWVLGFDRQRQQRLLSSLHLPALSWRGLLLALALALACGLLALAVFTRRGGTDPVQVQYRRYCNKLARIGLRRAAAEGALSFAQRTCIARPDLEPDVEAVTELYLRLRYSADSGGERLQTLRRRIARFRPQRKVGASLATAKAHD
jgi:transglutaminase-like putative cysteine protease